MFKVTQMFMTKILFHLEPYIILTEKKNLLKNYGNLTFLHCFFKEEKMSFLKRSINSHL